MADNDRDYDDEGYVNPGTDDRPLGRIGGRIQKALSFHSTTPPRSLHLGGGRWQLMVSWPPFVGVYVPDPQNSDKMYSARVGWRYDVNWGEGGYIGDVILKRMDHVVFH